MIQRIALAIFVAALTVEALSLSAPQQVEWPHRENCTGQPVMVGYGVVLYGPDKPERMSVEDKCWGDYVPSYLAQRQYPFRKILKPGETFRVPAGHHYATWINRGALVSSDHHAPEGALLTLPEVIE